MLFFWEGQATYPTSDYYKLSLGSDGTGKLLFAFDVEKGTQTATCLSTNEYDDGNWHHATAVRYVTNDKCELYITDLDGTNPESMITDSAMGSSSQINQDSTDRWYVASKKFEGNYFKGWIDDVMHWNGDALTSVQADDLSHTNYGTQAHKLDVNLDRTDKNGVLVSNLYTFAESEISFYDKHMQCLMLQ